jgi:hypothetical protein
VPWSNEKCHAARQSPEELQEALDAATRASSLTNQLLTFSRRQVVRTAPTLCLRRVRICRAISRKLSYSVCPFRHHPGVNTCRGRFVAD